MLRACQTSAPLQQDVEVVGHQGISPRAERCEKDRWGHTGAPAPLQRLRQEGTDAPEGKITQGVGAASVEESREKKGPDVLPPLEAPERQGSELGSPAFGMLQSGKMGVGRLQVSPADVYPQIPYPPRNGAELRIPQDGLPFKSGGEKAEFDRVRLETLVRKLVKGPAEPRHEGRGRVQGAGDEGEVVDIGADTNGGGNPRRSEGREHIGAHKHHR